MAMMAPTDPPPRYRETRWLTVAEAATELGVHPCTVREWTGKGLLPSYRTAGFHRRIPAEAVKRMVNQ